MVNIPAHELPDWMRQARRGVDWGILLVIGFCLIAAWPFIQNPTLPHTNASENYVYRTADYAEAMREGWLYPRWSPNALGGYGAPIPNFYPPGAAYTAAALQVLFTDDPVSAVRLLFILALCQAGSSLYVLVTRRAGASAGILAAILYVYSPYLGLVAPHILGDLPAVLSMALIPTLLWAIDRSLLIERPLDTIFIALSVSALCLTDPQVMLAGLALAMVMMLWHIGTASRRTSLFPIITATAIGIGIASFYWVPSLLEQHAVSWRAAMPTESFWLNLGGLLAPLSPIDPNEMVSTPQFTLGQPMLILGILAAIRFFHMARFQQLFLVLGLVITAICLIILPSETRLLGPITLCFAIGASGILTWRVALPDRWQRIIVPILLVIIWITAQPIWLAQTAQEAFGPTDFSTQLRYEQQMDRPAVLAPGASIPVNLRTSVTSNRLIANNPQTINKLSSSNFQVSLLGHFTHSDRFQIRRVLQASVVDVLTAYFPGWYAELSGRRITLWSAPETGLIRIQIPIITEGNGELLIALGTTDVRTGSWIISWSMLGIALVITLRRARTIKASFEDMALLTAEEARLTGFLLACFALILLLFAAPFSPFHLSFQTDVATSGGLKIESRTDAGLNLLALRLPRNTYRPAETLYLTLYWQARRFLEDNYRVKLYLSNTENDSQWAETGLRAPGYYPTQRWNTRQFVTDRYNLVLPPEIQAGNYQIKVEVYRCNPSCSSSLSFFDPSGQPQGTVFTLPTLIAIRT
jgi:hypothetical protein